MKTKVRPTNDRLDHLIEAYTDVFKAEHGFKEIVIERNDLATMLTCLRIVKDRTEAGSQFSKGCCSFKGEQS